jgi:glycosyltransferase involved in cell wall biosynthesis
MRDKSLVIHVGPLSSKGGMSGVMKLLINNPPKKYETKFLDTYISSSTINKVINLIKLRKKIKQDIKILNPDVFHFHVTHNYSWWRNLLLIKIAIKKKIPSIIHIHSGKFDIFCMKYNKLSGRILHKLSLNSLIKIVVLEERWLISLGKFSNNMSCIRNPVELEKTSTLDIEPKKGISLLLIARGDKIKGHNFAVEVMEYISQKGYDARLDMTGISKKTEKMKDLQIDTHGWLDNHEDIRKLIRDSDFLLSPSEFEGSSMSILESMALGTIPIVSKVSSETVSIKELVVENRDPKEWGERIIKILSESKEEELRRKVNEVIQKHEVSLISSQWEGIYEIIINKKIKQQ